jgi:GTPase SAR1 family protein
MKLEIQKKIVLVGPPNSGKTTIKKVFFQFGNPLQLLNNPLEPSRGVKTSIFSLFNSTIGVFDLAGQENKNWFSIDKYIFKKSNTIIIVFDIKSSIESIISFLVDIIKIKKLFGLHECSIFLFLHKVDLVNPSYVTHKIKSINNFFETQYRLGLNFQIYRTSIAEKYFFETYKILLQILNLILQKNSFPISKNEFKNLKTEIKIIIFYNNLKKYNIKDLKEKFDLNEEEVDFHLNRLIKLGFVYKDNETFKLTNRSAMIKENIEFEKKRIELMKSDKRIELFHVLSNLTETIY